jgi:hypothetical protein
MEDGGCRFHPDRSSVALRGGSRSLEHNENERWRLSSRAQCALVAAARRALVERATARFVG